VEVATGVGYDESMVQWNPSLPFNFRTVVFCFLAAAVCSPAITASVPPEWVHPLPTKYGHIPVIVLLISYLLLPLWSAFAVRKYKPLPLIWVALFIVSLVYGFTFLSLQCT
jgi:hypothetical protein